ncbi:uncharacterized protein LOC120650999 isoform X3 [Panicum virgatum]|uniref:uncharacterized protein LOC120650999 isoform X3 n=1 Tax=Panicum virgatum TaxID=38727 RepID=UPI0019D63F4E|nr:uncharacterized protein LOC120650999 isoform X3 [Panicum virgatum]
MFRNKVLVRAAASASSPLEPFLLRQLSLSAAAAPIAALDLEILCCRLSRRHRLACLPQPPADALLVFQGCQSREAAEAVSEVAAAFPGATVGEEEELVCSGELVAEAVRCELRSMMLEHGWTCLGQSIYVDSKFHQSEERTDLSAVNVEVRLGRNDDFEFVVSPDAFRYTSHKDIVRCSPQNSAWTSLWSFAYLRWPSSLVLQGSGLQPALKSARVSKAMSALQSFVELLKAWNFFGHNKLIIKEQVVLNSSSTLPTWDKAASNLIIHSSKNDNIENDLGHTNVMSKGQSFILDFRTPKPAVLCSLRAKSWNIEVHKIGHSAGDNDNLSGASPISDGFQSQLVAPNSLYKSQVTRLKPSFSRRKPSEKKKLRYSSEHPDADNSNKSSHRDAVANHANPVSSSNAILHMPVNQIRVCLHFGMQSIHVVSPVSENLGRNHAELLKARSQGGGGITKTQQDYLETKNLDSRRKSKGYTPTPSIQEVTKAIPDIEKYVLTTKVMNTKLNSVDAKDEVTAEAKRKEKQDLDKNTLTAVTKQKIVPEVVKNEFAIKARDNQNDDLKKKGSKSRAKAVDKDLLNSTRTKAKSDVASEELIAKVIDHHRRGELRLLTVADLKCFLGAKKAKVGGTKEVLIQRVTELLA